MFNLDMEHICDTYTKEIRSLLELAVPLWHSGLTVKLTRDIDRVQKLALGIILGENFVNYEVACTLMEIEPLNIRREQLCLNFARKNIKQENTLFTTFPNLVNTRSKKNVVVERKCNYKRFQNVSLSLFCALKEFCKTI